MHLPRPRFTQFGMMIIVAITGVTMGWTVHARNILHEEDDFGYGIRFSALVVFSQQWKCA